MDYPEGWGVRDLGAGSWGTESSDTQWWMFGERVNMRKDNQKIRII